MRTRMNKTENNLQTVWEQLDNASGELDNALTNLGMMRNIPGEVKKSIDLIDTSQIVNLKNEIEKLMNKKDQ